MQPYLKSIYAEAKDYGRIENFPQYKKEVQKAIKNAFLALKSDLENVEKVQRIRFSHFSLIKRLQDKVHHEAPQDLNIVIKNSPNSIYQVVYRSGERTFYTDVMLPPQKLNLQSVEQVEKALNDLCKSTELQDYNTQDDIHANVKLRVDRSLNMKESLKLCPKCEMDDENCECLQESYKSIFTEDTLAGALPSEELPVYNADLIKMSKDAEKSEHPKSTISVKESKEAAYLTSIFKEDENGDVLVYKLESKGGKWAEEIYKCADDSFRSASLKNGRVVGGAHNIQDVSEYINNQIDSYATDGIRLITTKDLLNESFSESKTAVEIGDSLYLNRVGMDDNGNKSIWISKGANKPKKIQTNQNLPVTHNKLKPGKDWQVEIPSDVKDEIKAYYKKHTMKEDYPHNFKPGDLKKKNDDSEELDKVEESEENLTAPKFCEALSKIVEPLFPDSSLKVKFENNLSPSVTMWFALRKKWINNIIHNDPFYAIFHFYGFNANGSCTGKMQVEGSMANTIQIKPAPDSKSAFDSIDTGWRKKTGTQAQVLRHVELFFTRLKQLVLENEDKLSDVKEHAKNESFKPYLKSIYEQKSEAGGNYEIVNDKKLDAIKDNHTPPKIEGDE